LLEIAEAGVDNLTENSIVNKIELLLWRSAVAPTRQDRRKSRTCKLPPVPNKLGGGVGLDENAAGHL
jgi:hypothetical protein